MSNFITPLCYTTLVAEIHNIKNEQIPAIADEISIARSHGDLRENAQYASAKERQRAVGTQPITFAFQQQNCGLGMESTLLVALLKKRRSNFYHKPRQYKCIYANDKNIWNFKHKP